jgi:uncharacterized membrane protein YjfL (UPF0719 family)
MEHYLSAKALCGAIVYSLLGMGVFFGGFFLFDRFTPGNFWKEILEEHNTALAVIVGAVAIGISLIIAAAVQG